MLPSLLSEIANARLVIKQKKGIFNILTDILCQTSTPQNAPIFENHHPGLQNPRKNYIKKLEKN